tara:strand:+ start:137 stop:1009 length:873 start_codon:yes stop_codon:yes gene_type:complete
MSSVYRKKSGTYYLSVSYQGQRLTKSLHTKNYKTARSIKPDIEKELLTQIIHGANPEYLIFKDLMLRYLEYDHGWKNSTYELNKRLLNGYIKTGFPKNKTTRAMTVRVINSCNRWGFKNELISNYNPIPGGNNYNVRDRVFTVFELRTLFENVTPEHFNQFVQFAYYTGARSGEIRRISSQNIFFDYMFVDGKSGRRIVKLNSQARGILDNNLLWDYTINYVPLTWRRNVKRLGITNARFHDLRRTFGYNLIKQGRPIYEVSKLLGHSSVTTTEKHYAPLLTTEIGDFEL